ncbi:cobalamin biosynthesis family protein [Vibrio sp. WXL103]|uniref:cobalamin biosynthesis family protein n=1 Tax=unclassified Vibrio TaxID=2614977 RepID=UPI003EC8C781
MEGILGSYYANGMVLIMWGALLAHLALPIPRLSHPIEWWRRFALLLSAKVNSQNPQQAALAGSLAMALMLLPTALLLMALNALSWQSELFQLGLLILALDWRNSDGLVRELTQAMADEDKFRARALLAPWVNRQTDSLSMLGLGKAGAETYLMAMGRGVIGVLFWFSLLGGIGAMLYRLTIELARVWSPSRQSYSPFGQASTRLTAALDVVPLRLFSLLILIGGHTQHNLSLVRQQATSWALPGPSWLLISSAAKYQLALGGPAIYESRKSLRAKIGGRIAPAAIHLSQLRQMMTARTLIWVALLSLFLLTINQGL